MPACVLNVAIYNFINYYNHLGNIGQRKTYYVSIPLSKSLFTSVEVGLYPLNPGEWQKRYGKNNKKNCKRNEHSD